MKKGILLLISLIITTFGITNLFGLGIEKKAIRKEKEAKVVRETWGGEIPFARLGDEEFRTLQHAVGSEREPEHAPGVAEWAHEVQREADRPGVLTEEFLGEVQRFQPEVVLQPLKKRIEEEKSAALAKSKARAKEMAAGEKGLGFDFEKTKREAEVGLQREGRFRRGWAKGPHLTPEAMPVKVKESKEKYDQAVKEVKDHFMEKGLGEEEAQSAAESEVSAAPETKDIVQLVRAKIRSGQIVIPKIIKMERPGGVTEGFVGPATRPTYGGAMLVPTPPKVGVPID